MAVSTSNAPELTTEQVHAILTQPLEQASTFLAAGPRIFDTDGSPVRIPRAPESGAADLTWTGENELIPEQDPEFGELLLMPNTLKSVKTITRYSNELARQSVVSIEGALRDRLVADVSAKIDAQFLSASDGMGTEDEAGVRIAPRGIFAYAGTTIADAGEMSLDVVLEAQGTALGANVNPAGMTLFITPALYMALRALKDGDGRYLVQPDVTSGGTVLPILGARVAVSSHVPEGSAALVDMSRVAVARDLAPSVKILTERYADYDQQAIRVVARYDAGPIDPAAVVAMTGLTVPTPAP